MQVTLSCQPRPSALFVQAAHHPEVQQLAKPHCLAPAAGRPWRCRRSNPPDLLLDTHALLWWLAEPDRLSPAAHGAIADPGNRVHVSGASGREIATKVRLGKLPAASELLDGRGGLPPFLWTVA